MIWTAVKPGVFVDCPDNKNAVIKNTGRFDCWQQAFFV
jgi:hypothetical protein